MLKEHFRLDEKELQSFNLQKYKREVKIMIVACQFIAIIFFLLFYIPFPSFITLISSILFYVFGGIGLPLKLFLSYIYVKRQYLEYLQNKN